MTDKELFKRIDELESEIGLTHDRLKALEEESHELMTKVFERFKSIAEKYE